MPTKRLRLLLLDANVVIQLHELGLWSKIVEDCDVHLARTVVDESNYFESDGQRFPIDIRSDETSGRLRVFEVMASSLQTFLHNFDPAYAEKLDPGEAESLAYLDAGAEDFLFCSGDAIVYRVLAVLERSEQGVSLEEVLQKAGCVKPLPYHFGKKFRESVTQQGVADRMQGRGLRRRR